MSSSLCYSFERDGTCKYEDACKFIHSLAAQRRHEENMHRDVRDSRPSRARPSSRRSAPSSKRRNNDCWTWQETGTCARANCRFVHGERREDGKSGRPVGPRRITGGAIGRAREAVRQRKNAAALALVKSVGDKACYQFIVTGNCTFGDSCDYDHSPTKKGADSSEQRVGRVGFLAAKIALEKAQGKACDQWTYLGRCVFGDECKFDHPGGGDIRARADRVGACYSFASHGFCSYGDSCKFEHVSPEDMDDAPSRESRSGSDEDGGVETTAGGSDGGAGSLKEEPDE